MIAAPMEHAARTAGAARFAPATRVPFRETTLLALGAAAFLYLVAFRRGTFIYLFHKATTGVWVDEGARVAGGETMYRDFSDVVGPGIVYLNAGLIRLFGARLDVLAWAGIAVGVAVALVLHALAARVAGRAARLVAPVLFVVLVYGPGRDFGGPEWPALALILAGLLPFMGRPASLARACVAGVAMGLASLFQFEMGVGAMLGVAAHIVRDERGRGRACGVFGLACLAAPALVMGAFALGAGPESVLSSWLATPWRHRLAEFRLDLGQPAGIGLAARAVLVLGGAAAAVASLRPGRPPAETGTRLVARAGLGVLLAPAVAHADPYTLTLQSTVLIVCLSDALARLGPPRPSAGWVARGAAAAVLAVGVAHGALGLVVLRQLVQVQVRQRFRAGSAWIGAPARDLEWIEANTAPGDAVVVFPAGGMFYFLTGTRNATSYPAMVEGRFTVEDQRRALAEIERSRPAIGVWLGAERFDAGPGVPTLDTLYEGIRRSYEPEKALANGTLLLRRRRDPGP
jgi:hypothetical protein